MSNYATRHEVMDGDEKKYRDFLARQGPGRWTLPASYRGNSGEFLGTTFELLALANNSFLTEEDRQ